MDKQVLRKRIIPAANSPKAEEIIRKTLSGPPLEFLSADSCDSQRKIAA